LLDDLIASSKRDQIIFRLWAKDPSIFGQNQSLMLDWLDEPREMLEHLESLQEICRQVKERSFSAIVLLGMGGSSLAVKVFQEILAPGAIKFLVLDTIHPAAIERVQENIDLSSTLFIVASKSGSTLEPNLLYRYFLSELKNIKVKNPSSHFMAITDPNTPLAKEAAALGFLTGAAGNPLIGGRYSALSPFGLVPALLMDIDAKKLLETSMTMLNDCGPTVMIEHNPGALLGLFLAANALKGYDQLVFHFSPKLKTLGLWLEQLIAESLGKQQNGIVPITEGNIDHLALPKAMHCVLELAGDPILSSTKEALKKAQVAVVYLDMPELYALGAEMFRWQIAVSSAGSVLKLNPFDQPDVEKSKLSAALILKQMSEKKFVAPQGPCFSSSALDIFAHGSDKETINILASFFSAIKNGDYCGILSYLDETDKNLSLLQSLVLQISQRSVPTLLESGPRYLHSVGQLFKGGKNNGHFILITGTYDADLTSDLGLSFKDIHLSQAFGDYQAMLDEGRHILHIHLKDIVVGFRELLALSKHM
jgi:transaldolase/glucose-6-phosphate isomerase